MNASILLKSILAKLLESIGAVERNILKKCDSKFLILMYHRVIPYKEAESGLQAGMYVEPETFNMHIQYLKKYFDIFPLSKIVTVLKYSSGRSSNKPICILTFDDGWFDFYKYAYPILAAQNVPATVFLPTEFIGGDKWFWTDKLTKIFVEKERNKENINTDCNSCGLIVKNIIQLRGSLNAKIENAISMLKKYSEDQINSAILELMNVWRIHPDFRTRTFLTWEEVREMKDSGFITFGSHTVNHKILSNQSSDTIMEELVRSKNVLIEKNVVNPLFIPFCYPNGNWNDDIVSMVRKSGYHLAVTTENGWNQSDTSLFALRRVGIHQDISSSQAMFGCRTAKMF